MSAGDGTEKIVPREEAPVDVNAKSGPRVVFPPLNQNEIRRRRSRVPRRALRRPSPAMARCQTANPGRSRPLPSQAIRPTQPLLRLRRHRPPRRPRQNRRPQRERLHQRLPRELKPRRLPMRRCHCRRRPISRLRPRSRAPGWRPSILLRPRRQIAPSAGAGGGDIWFRSPRNATRPTRRPRSGPCRASSRPYWDRAPAHQARRPRRKGRLLPRHGRPVRVAGRSLPVLRQPENRRRAVRRPKELTAVSLTLVDPRGCSGLIGPHEPARIHHWRIRNGT